MTYDYFIQYFVYIFMILTAKFLKILNFISGDRPICLKIKFRPYLIVTPLHLFKPQHITKVSQITIVVR